MPKGGPKRPPVRTLDERNELVLKNYKLSWHMVRKMRHLECVKRLGLHDAAQAGFLAMLRAADQWDPNKGAQFSTYACTSIWKAIMDACSDACPIPSNKSARRNGRFPPGHIRPLPPSRVDVTDAVFLQDDPEQAEVLDLHQALTLLPARWRRVLDESFVHGRTYHEIGLMLGVTKERVRQIRAEALAWLRSYMEGETTTPPATNSHLDQEVA